MHAQKPGEVNDQHALRSMCVVALALLVSGVVLGADRYVFTGYIDRGTAVERESYTVVVPEPQGVLKAFNWRNFEDQRNPQNVIINLGAGKNLSWAATVRSKGHLKAGETLAERVASVYPKEVYSELITKHGKAQCVIADSAGNDQKGLERFYEYVAVCSPRGHSDIYELLFSEANLAGKDQSPGLRDVAVEFFTSLEFR